MSASNGFFIDDGFTVRAYIAECERLHPALRFEFRPMLVTERSAMARDYERRSNEPAAKISAEYVARKILSWSAPGKPTAEAIVKLKPRLFDRLVAIVGGQEAGDIDPQTLEQAQPFDQEAVAKN